MFRWMKDHWLCLDSLVGIEGLVEADQVRIVSSLVRFGLGCCRQFNANNGFGIGHVCDRLECVWL
jgi:hypothetical protein